MQTRQRQPPAGLHLLAFIQKGEAALEYILLNLAKGENAAPEPRNPENEKDQKQEFQDKMAFSAD